MENIIEKLNIYIIPSLPLFVDKYPELKELLNKSTRHDPVSEWDFYMTVAGAYLISKEMELKAIDTRINSALKNLVDFLHTDKGEISAVGLWVLWNVKGEKPTYQECTRLASAITDYLLKIKSDLLS